MNEQVTRRVFLEAVVVAGVALPLSKVLPGTTADARRLMERAIRQHERAWESLSDTAWPTVIAMFTEVIGIEPQNQLALFYRGKAHSWSGSYERAAADFFRAIHTDPTDESGLDWSYSYTAIRAFDKKMGSRKAALRHWLDSTLRRAATAKAKHPTEV